VRSDAGELSQDSGAAAAEELAAGLAKKKVAIIGDYDKCFDIIFQTDEATRGSDARSGLLLDYMKNITYWEDATEGQEERPPEEIMRTKQKRVRNADGTVSHEYSPYYEWITHRQYRHVEVDLFVGSDCQSSALDADEAERKSNGLCKEGFEQLAERMTRDAHTIRYQWQFESARLSGASAGDNEILGNTLAAQVMTTGVHAVKRAMAKEAVKRAMAKELLANPILRRAGEVYCFDADSNNLKVVCEEVSKRRDRDLQFKFYTVHFDWTNPSTFEGGGPKATECKQTQ